IQIDDLWGLKFGNRDNNFNTLFFTAGINDEQDGLFGRIETIPSSAGDSATPHGMALAGTAKEDTIPFSILAGKDTTSHAPPSFAAEATRRADAPLALAAVAVDQVHANAATLLSGAGHGMQAVDWVFAHPDGGMDV